MTISNIGAAAATQLSSVLQKQAKPDTSQALAKTSIHHPKSKGGQPSLSDSLQSLLLGQQSKGPTLQQVAAKAQAAYAAAK
jgi:hypothetical protein